MMEPWTPIEPTPENLALLQSTITRKCGECTACCFTFANEHFKKPECTWCHLAVKKKGCKEYETRPQECRYFFCTWLQGAFTEKDRPDKVGVVFDIEPCAHLMMSRLLPEAREGRVMTRVTQMFAGSAFRERARELINNMSYEMPVAVRSFGSPAQDLDLVVKGVWVHLWYVEFVPPPKEMICWSEDKRLADEVKAMSTEEKTAALAGARDEAARFGNKRTVAIANPCLNTKGSFLTTPKAEVE